MTPEWIRFNVIGPQLRINEAEVADSGVYVCRAVNGFGSPVATMKLVIGSDPAGDDALMDPTVSYVSVDELDDLDEPLEDLSFTHDTLRQPRYLRLTTGSFLLIQCSASGYPVPHLVWLKDGKEWIGQKPSTLEDPDGYMKVARLSLEIPPAGPTTAGNYTCLARGVRQTIDVTFTIEVLGILCYFMLISTFIWLIVFRIQDMQKRMIRNQSEVLPANVTELRGGRARFHCWIYSPSPPVLVQWLKRLPKAPYRGQVNSNTSLVVGEEQYQGKTLLEQLDDGHPSFSLL